MTAWHHWSAMHAWWCARRDEREPIGKPWAPKGSPKKSSTTRQTKDVGSLLASGGEQETVAAWVPPAKAGIPATDATKRPAVSDPFDGLVAPSSHDDERRALIARVNALAGEHAEHLKAAAVVLQLKLSRPELWPVERFSDIAIALREIELAVGPDPFAEEMDESAAVRNFRKVEPTDRIFNAPDEGPTVDPTDVAALRKAFDALEPGDKAWVESLLREARAAGVPFGALGDNPTLRRFGLGRACVRMGTHYAESNDHVVALLTLALGEEPQPAPLGALIGSLSAPEAVRFAKVVDAFVAGNLVASFSDDGRMVFAHAS